MWFIILTLLLKIAPLYLLITLGYLAGKKLRVDKDSVAALLIYIVVPVIVFHGAATATLNISMFVFPLTLFLIASGLCLVAKWLGSYLWKDATVNLLAFASGSGNTGYFGLPVAIAVFGEPIISILVFGVMGFIVYENTIGFYTIARGHHTPKQAFQKLLRLPTLYTFIAGMLLNQLSFTQTDWYTTSITAFRGTYTVLGMMMIGLGLASISEFKQIDWKFIGVALVNRFLAWPAIVLATIWLDAQTVRLFNTEVIQVMMLLSVVPLAANTIGYASILNIHPEKAALAVTLSTLVALVWIPLFLALFHLA